MVESIVYRLKTDPHINVFREMACGGKDEYEALKEFLRRADAVMFSRYPQVLLFYVSQFMRREVFKRGRLWKDLWLSIDMPEDSHIRLYERIAAAFSRMGIELIREGYNGRRLFVETFWREVGITSHNVREFLEIFWWYYDNYYPKREFDEEVFRKNQHYHDFDEQFYLISDAVEKLIAVVEFVQDPNHPLIESPNDTNITEFKTKLYEKLAFDPLQILPSEEYIIQVYARCLNYVTSPKFKQIIGRKNSGMVLTPWGKLIPGHVVLADTNIAFGEYIVEGSTYRVSPHPKVDLQGMATWPMEKIIQPLPGFVGYRSKKIFTVRRNHDELGPTQLYWNRSLKGYVWCGRIPIGGSLFVDNTEVPPLEGIQFQPALKLRWPNTEIGVGPELEIELGTVMVNEPELRGKKIEIRIGDFVLPAVVGMTGACRFDVPAVRLVPQYDGGIVVRIMLEDRVLVERFVGLADTMLFSESTRGKISKKRKWSEDNKFYLFSIIAINVEAVKGARVEKEYSYGKYHVYYIVRTGIELKICEGDEYELFEPEFIQLRIEGDYSGSTRVIYKLDELSILALTNVVEERINVKVHIYRDMELIRSSNYDVRLNKINSTLSSLVLDGRAIFKDIPYGQYTVMVDTDAVKSNSVVFSFIPAPKAVYGAEHTYAEGEPIVVTAKWDGRLSEYATWARVEQRMIRNKVTCNSIAVEAKFDLFKEGIVDFPARYTHLISPIVFGIRILHPISSDDSEGESILSHPERGDLKGAILYAFGRPRAEVNVSLSSVITRFEFDENGELRVPLFFLINKLTNHINMMSVRSEGLEHYTAIRWWPRIVRSPKMIRLHTSVYYEFQVFGPADVMLEVRVVDIYGAVYQRDRHNLTGNTAVVGGHLYVASGVRYITLGYVVAGEYVSTHVQYRIPDKVIRCGSGIGVSMEYLTVSAWNLLGL